MSKTTTGDFRKCKLIADQFYHLAHVLDEQDPFSLIYGTCYPFAVNLALACELYMKTIMIFESGSNSFVKGHYLDELFSELPADYQLRIQKEYKDSFESTRSFEFFIKSQRDLFTSWRYAFENGKDGMTLDYSGLVVLGRILNKIVEELDQR